MRTEIGRGNSIALIALLCGSSVDRAAEDLADLLVTYRSQGGRTTLRPELLEKEAGRLSIGEGDSDQRRKGQVGPAEFHPLEVLRVNADSFGRFLLGQVQLFRLARSRFPSRSSPAPMEVRTPGRDQISERPWLWRLGLGDTPGS
jgi:hypothetical protein